MLGSIHLDERNQQRTSLTKLLGHAIKPSRRAAVVRGGRGDPRHPIIIGGRWLFRGAGPKKSKKNQ
jgi:hypothetical protein